MENQTAGFHYNSECVGYSSPHCIKLTIFHIFHSPLENRGGSFDSAGKFQASTSENNRRALQQASRERDEYDDEQDDDWGDQDDMTSPGTQQQHQNRIPEQHEEDESHFEDEEVDVDDLPSELKRDTLEQREREKIATSSSKQTPPAPEEKETYRQEQQPSTNRQQPPPEPAPAEEVPSTNNALDESNQPVHWIYLDPQGNTQGPFNGTDMLDWFNAGYFPQDLMLRRTNDRRFIQLGEMTKRYGRIPFLPGPNAPAPLPEVEPLPQQPSQQEQEEKQRLQQQQQHAMLYHQLQQQALMLQQLIQQQQLFILQQQQQGASPSALAIATQQISEHQKQHQQLLTKMVQITLLQQQHQQQQQQPPSPQHVGGSVMPIKEFSASPSPLDYVSPLDLLQQRAQLQQQQHTPVTAPFEMPKPAETRQQGGLEFVQSFGNSGGGSGGNNSNGGYDPIKSLLSQLQETTLDYPNQASSSFGNNASGSASNYSSFGGIPQQQQQQQPGSRPGSGHQV